MSSATNEAGENPQKTLTSEGKLSSIGNVLTRLSMVNQPTGSDKDLTTLNEQPAAPENGTDGLLQRGVDAARGVVGNMTKLAMAATVVAPLAIGNADKADAQEIRQIAQVPMFLLPASMGLYIPDENGNPLPVDESAVQQGAVDEREAMVCGADGEKCIPLQTWISLDEDQRNAAADECAGVKSDSRAARNEYKRLKVDPDATTTEISEAKAAKSVAARVARACYSALNKFELASLKARGERAEQRMNDRTADLIAGAKKELN